MSGSSNSNNRYYYHPHYITGLGDGSKKQANSQTVDSSSAADSGRYESFLRKHKQNTQQRKSSGSSSSTTTTGTNVNKRLRYHRGAVPTDDLEYNDRHNNGLLDDDAASAMDHGSNDNNLNNGGSRNQQALSWANFFGTEPDPFAPRHSTKQQQQQQREREIYHQHRHAHRKSVELPSSSSAAAADYYSMEAPWQLSAFALLGAVVLLSALFLHVLADTTAETQAHARRQRRRKMTTNLKNSNANIKVHADLNHNNIINNSNSIKTAAEKEKTDDDAVAVAYGDDSNPAWAVGGTYGHHHHHHHHHGNKGSTLGASSSYDDDDGAVLMGIAGTAGGSSQTGAAGGTAAHQPPSLYHPYYQPRLRNRAQPIPGNTNLYRSPKPSPAIPRPVVSPIPQPQFAASNNNNNNNNTSSCTTNPKLKVTTTTTTTAPPRSRTQPTTPVMSPRMNSHHATSSNATTNHNTAAVNKSSRKTLTPPHIYKPTKSQSSLQTSNHNSTIANKATSSSTTAPAAPSSSLPPVPYMNSEGSNSIPSFAKKPVVTRTTTTPSSRARRQQHQQHLSTTTAIPAIPPPPQAPLSPLLSEDPSEQSSSSLVISEALQAPSVHERGSNSAAWPEDSTHRWTNIGRNGEEESVVFDEPAFIEETPRIGNGGRKIIQEPDLAFASPPPCAPDMPFLPPLPPSDSNKEARRRNAHDSNRNATTPKNKKHNAATALDKKFQSAQQQQQSPHKATGAQRPATTRGVSRPHAINVDDLHIMESGNWHAASAPSPPPPPEEDERSLPPAIPSHDEFPSFGILNDENISSQNSVTNDDRPTVDHVRPNLITDTDAAKSLQGAIDFSELELVEVIGGGGFGQVWRANWRSTPVAVKVLSGSAQSQKVPRAVLEEFAAEINLLRGMRHPNICLYMGACLQPPNRAIITELAANGSLWDALRLPLNPPYRPVGRSNGGMSETEAWPPSLYRPDPRHGLPPSRTNRLANNNAAFNKEATTPTIPAGTWSWALVKRVACGTARGMVYLHSGTPPVLHRDLKSANILLDESYNPKVCDFGLSRLQSAAGASMTGNCGTVQWMAPEVLANQRYNEKADVFSYGIILWELLTRACPYEGQNAVQCALAVLNRNHRPSIPQWCPPVLHALVRACLKTDPQERPDFTKILTALESMPTS